MKRDETAIETIIIKSKKELSELVENKNTLEKLQEVSIEVPHIGIIESNQLEGLNIQKIIVRDSENDDILELYTYTIEQYKILQQKIKEIIEGIPREFTELQKFVLIYKRLGTKISYDYRLINEENREEKSLEYESEYVTENRINARNLINGLIKGKCVCAGYSDILYNCLNVLGIENCKAQSDNHAWNKVKMDGKWYNVDLTNDSDEIFDDKVDVWEYCLISDEKFEYNQIKGKKVECDSDYRRENLKKAIEEVRKFEREKEKNRYEENKMRVKQQRKQLFNRVLVMTKLFKRDKIEEHAVSIQGKREEWIANIKNNNDNEISQVATKEVEAVELFQKGNESERE